MVEDIGYSEFLGTENCALCRGQFPRRTVQGPDAWQSDFRAILCLDPKCDSNIGITELSVLPNFGLDITLALSDPQRDLRVTICRDAFPGWKDRIEQKPFCLAFCVHDWCYSILMWKVPECSLSTLYSLSRSLIPKPSIWENIPQDIAGKEHHLERVATLKTLITRIDCYLPAIQLPFILRLPPEIRSCIFEYVGLSAPYSAFILVAGETARLVSHLQSPSSRDIVLKRGSYLTAKMRTVFKTDYIQDTIICEHNSEANSEVLGVVTGVKFVAGVGGICAIKLVGSDWETDWVGKLPPSTACTWHGLIPGPVSVLHVGYNDLNCADNISTSDPCSTNQIMWDRYHFPFSIIDAETALFDYCRDISGSIHPIRKTPRRRFLRYLHLYSNEEYTRGLTVYTVSGHVLGIEAHFSGKSRLLEFRIGCPQYFLLQEGERIAYTWLRIYDMDSLAFNQRSLVIQTTFGRQYSFGPYILPHHILRNDFKWILLKSKGCVSGFYYENTRWPTGIASWGIAGDGLPVMVLVQPPKYHAIPDYPPIAVPNYLFFSTAMIGHLSKVNVCRVGSRCTGMLIKYVNGTRIAIGQWHSSHVSQHACVYNSDEPGISHIYFRMSNFMKHQIVTDIGFLTDFNEGDKDFDYRVFSIQTPIIWWFSEFYDEILPWKGQVLDVPEKSQMRQDLLILQAQELIDH